MTLDMFQASLIKNNGTMWRNLTINYFSRYGI